VNAGDLLFGRRLRQNHALEHATVTIMTERHPRLRVAARASAHGFVIYADLDPDLVRPAVEEALRRLRRGEADLAIHPHCGTNLAVGTSVALVGSFFALTAVRPRVRAVSALASSLAGIAAARPLGKVVQRHVTTLPDVVDVRILAVARRRRLGMGIVDVRTAAG
jgi:hypothetical protein